MASRRIDTKLIHAGQPRIAGAVEMPIFQSAMFEYTGETSYHDLGYIRLNNTPNHKALHAKLAALEGSEDALITASGMAAISTTLLTVLSAGDHLLAQSTLYGGTQDLIIHDFPKLGIAVDLIDADDSSSWPAKLRPNTKAIYVEAMTNPLLEVADLEGRALKIGVPRSDGRSTLLLFVSPTCPVCKTLLPAVLSSRKDERGWLDVILASDGELQEQREFVRRQRLEVVPYVVSAALGLAYQVGRLPFAALLDEQGIVRARGLVNSREHLESLFEAKRLGVASLQEYFS